MVITVTSVVVMIICYSMMAMILLVNVQAAHRHVAVASKKPAPGPPTVPTSIYVVPNDKGMDDVTSSKNSSMSRIT